MESKTGRNENALVVSVFLLGLPHALVGRLKPADEVVGLVLGGSSDWSEAAP